MAEQPMGPEDWKAVHDALNTLHAAAAGDSQPHEDQVTDAFRVLVDFIGLMQQTPVTPGPGVESARLEALWKLLRDSGDITPMGQRMVEKILLDGQ